MTFEPRSSPDPPEVGPDVFAVALQHTAERDEARRQRDEQVALRDEEREAANAAFKAADAERETHLATIRNKDREIASLKARLRGAAVSDENVESEVEEPAEDALKEKKGAIKAYLFTKCLPRVLENLVDDEDDD